MTVAARAYYVPQVDGLSLHGAVNWNHARFTKLNNVPCWGGQTIAQGCDQVRNPATGLFTSQDLKGAPLVRAPNWQANFGFDYETDVGKGMKLVVASSTQYSSKYLANLGYLFYQPSFFKTDLTLRNDRTTDQDVLIAWLAQGNADDRVPLFRVTLRPSSGQEVNIPNIVDRLGFSGLGSLVVIAVDESGNLDPDASIDGSSRICARHSTRAGPFLPETLASRRRWTPLG